MTLLISLNRRCSVQNQICFHSNHKPQGVTVIEKQKESFIIMGKYSDFDLDLNQVKEAGNLTGNPKPNSTITLTLLTPLQNCSGTSCDCSMSDMTLCGAAIGGKTELLRC